MIYVCTCKDCGVINYLIIQCRPWRWCEWPFLASKWRVHRKLIMPTFNPRILESFVEVFAVQSKILVQQMEIELDGAEFDVFNYISLCTLDIICGKSFICTTITLRAKNFILLFRNRDGSIYQGTDGDQLSVCRRCEKVFMPFVNSLKPLVVVLIQVFRIHWQNIQWNLHENVSRLDASRFHLQSHQTWKNSKRMHRVFAQFNKWGKNFDFTSFFYRNLTRNTKLLLFSFSRSSKKRRNHSWK